MEKFYVAMLQYIRKSAFLQRTIIAITRYFPMITFILYPCVLLYLFISKSPFLFETIWKPFAAFLVVTVFRKIVNRPRPYEAMNIEPLIGHKHGESFPSRHTVSAFAIAFALLNINIHLGIIALIIACIVGLSRIICAVHFISDVLCGFLIALIIYLI